MNEPNNQLLSSREHFEKIFKALPTPSYIWRKINGNLILIDYNDAADEIIEGNMKNFLGIRASELYKDNPQILDDLKRCINGETIPLREILYKYKTLKFEKNLAVTYRFIPPDLILVHTDDLTKQKEFEDSLNKFKKVSDNANYGIAMSDLIGNLIYINEYFASIHGYKAEELIGRNLSLLHNNKQLEKVMELVEILQREGNYNAEEVLHTHKDGSVFPMLMNGVLIKDEHGKPLFMAATAIDISEHKKIEEKLTKEREKAELYLNLVNVILIALDRNGIITLLNKKGYEILEYEEGELIGKNWFDNFIKEEIREEIRVVFNQLITGEIDPVEYYENPILTKEGDEKMIAWHNTILKDEQGKVIGTLSSGEDITTRKIAEEKLKDSEEKYRNAYNRSNLYKDIFTHDINNILQNILTSTELTKLYSKDPNQREKYKDVSNLLSEQIIRGRKLVSNVQKLSEVEEIKTPIASMEASSILSKAIAFVEDSFPHREINIEVKSFQNQFFVNANELLVNIFENILFNAVKHNVHENIEILIRISKDRKNEKNYIKFEFLDNGVGIPDSMKPEIFSRKYKEYKKDNVPSGIGLGLLLVNRILESYNGEIRVEDRFEGDYSKGSNFIIMIPEVV